MFEIIVYEIILGLFGPILVYLLYNYLLKKKSINLKTKAENKTSNNSLSKIVKVYNLFFFSKKELELYTLVIQNLDSIYNSTNSKLVWISRLSFKSIRFVMFIMAINYSFTFFFFLINGKINVPDDFGIILIFTFTIIILTSLLLLKFVVLRKIDSSLYLKELQGLEPFVFFMPIVILLTIEIRTISAIVRFLFSSK